MARTRSAIVLPLILVLLLVSSVLGVLGLWTTRQFLEHKSWETMSSELIADPAIQTQVADQVTTAIVDGTNVEQTLAQALPPRLAPLAAPAAVALRDGTRRVVLRALRTPRVQQAWTVAVVATQRQAVNLITGEGAAIRLPGGGGVIIDLRPLTGDVAAELGLPRSVVDRIPEQATRVRLVRGDELEAARSTMTAFKKAVILFIVLTPLLAIAAVAASPPGKRRRASIGVALTLGLAALLILAFRRLAGSYLVEALGDGNAAGPAVASVWAISTSLLTSIAGGVLLLGSLLLIGALLAGESRPALTIRRWLAPAFAQGPLVVHSVVLGVGVAAVAAGVVPFIERPLGLVLLLLTLIAGTELVRRAPVEIDGLPPQTAEAATQVAGSSAGAGPEASSPGLAAPVESGGPSPAASSAE